RADPREEETPRPELGLQRERLVGRKRDEEPARGLRVVAEREELLGRAVRLDRRELAVAPVAPGADAFARRLACAGERGQSLEHDADAAPLGHLVGVTEEAEAGDVGDRV